MIQEKEPKRPFFEQAVSDVGRTRSLSESIWGFRWASVLPPSLNGTAVTVKMGSYEETKLFLDENFEKIYESDLNTSPFAKDSSGENKKKFYALAVDIFIFRDNEKMIGFFLGNPIDWSSYYLRHCSILPEFQSQKIYQHFLNFLIPALEKVGVQRCEGDVAPSNLPHIHILNKLGFNITGTNLHDRWGSLLKFTKYLKTESLNVFLDQFCFGKRFQS